MHVGERIQERMNQKRISQNRLAKLAQISQSGLSSIIFQHIVRECREMLILSDSRRSEALGIETLSATKRSVVSR